MKQKIHIDIGQYEFIEIEKDEPFTKEEVITYWQTFHKLTDKKQLNRTAKVQNRTYDFVQDLPEPDEAINIDD